MAEEERAPILLEAGRDYEGLTIQKMPFEEWLDYPAVRAEYDGEVIVSLTVRDLQALKRVAEMQLAAEKKRGQETS